MKDNGLQPDRVAYNAVFTALRIANMPDEVGEKSIETVFGLLSILLTITILSPCQGL